MTSSDGAEVTLGSLITAAKGDQTDTCVAARIGTDNSTISRWRRGLGWPKPVMYPALAEFLGITVKELEVIVTLERSAVGIRRYEGTRAEFMALEHEFEGLKASQRRLEAVLQAQADQMRQLEQLVADWLGQQSPQS